MNMLRLQYFLLSFTTILALPIPNFLLGEPESDSFYQAPDNLSELKNGEVYNQRQVTPDLQISLTFSEAYQVAYKTTNTQDEDSHSVATVLKPQNPAKDNKLFSYQFWEDADQLKCSPSYTLVKGALAPDGFTGILDTAVIIKYALEQGWTVVVPDHEGPRSAFSAGYEQGQAGLDGIRAASNFSNWETNTPTTMYGYSGGASATAWMANLQESYFPELNVKGAAYGGTPVDTSSASRWLDKTEKGLSGFIVGGITGLLKAYPKLNETAWVHLNQKFKDRINTMTSGENCVATEVLKMGYTEYETMVDVDFWSFEPLLKILHRETLFENSTGTISVPKFPRYIFHADSDEVITAAAVRTYVSQQCSKGANIQYVPWKGNDHVSVEYLGIPDALQFSHQAYEDKTPNVLCGSPNDDVLTLGSKVVGATLGQVFADLLSAFNGFVYDGIKIVFNPDTPYEKGITAEAQ